jgi:hypothetical protein
MQICKQRKERFRSAYLSHVYAFTNEARDVFSKHRAALKKISLDEKKYGLQRRGHRFNRRRPRESPESLE